MNESSTNSQITPSSHKVSISTGPMVKGTSQTISSAGGTISVNSPDTPLNGFSIQVPPNAFSQNTTFTISYHPIIQHTLGSHLHPISPLIQISNGGVYSSEFMIVQIPVKIPDDDFATAFLYDEQSGDLEALPLIEENSTFITVGTRHFSNIVVFSISKNLLLNITVDSKFRPGIDDWQFKNLGTILTPKGRCSGMSKSAIWYYYEQKITRNAPSLYGLYDNNGHKPPTPELMADDALAHRFTSVVQKDYRSDIQSHPEKYGETVATTTNQFQIHSQIVASILVSGKPQLLSLMNEDDSERHQVIVYNVLNGTLFIADPNYPGDYSRKIEFADGTFQKYKLDDLGDFVVRAYVGYSQVPWDIMWDRWTEFKDQTIGINQFPAFDGYIEFNKKDPEAPGGIFFGDHAAGRNIGYPAFALNSDEVTNEISISTGCSGATQSCSAKEHLPEVKLYLDGQFSDETTVFLKDGDNIIGILYYSRVDNREVWVGFDWITINYKKITPTPTPMAQPPVPITPIQLTQLINTDTSKNPPVSAGGHNLYPSCYGQMVGFLGPRGKIDRLQFRIIKNEKYTPPVPLTDISFAWCDSIPDWVQQAWCGIKTPTVTVPPEYPGCLINSCGKRHFCIYKETSHYIPILYEDQVNLKQIPMQSYAGPWGTVYKGRWGTACGLSDNTLEYESDCGNYFIVEIKLNEAYELSPCDEVYILYTVPRGTQELSGQVPPKLTEINCIK